MKKYSIYFLIIALISVLIVISAFLLKARISPSSPNQQSQTSVVSSPTTVQAPSSSSVGSTSISRDQFIKILPIQTPKFDIEYLSISDKINITIKEGPFEKVKKESEEWLKQLGVNDFTSFNISWSSYRYVE